MAAARYYFGLVWTIDRSYVSAGFGTARAFLAGGDRVAAIAAIAAVPETSSHHAAAQIAAVRLLVAGGAGRSEADLRQADFRLGKLSLDDNDPRRHQLAVEILRAALDWVSAAAPTSRPGTASNAAALAAGAAHPRLRAERAGAALRARARLPRARQPGTRAAGRTGRHGEHRPAQDVGVRRHGVPGAALPGDKRSRGVVPPGDRSAR